MYIIFFFNSRLVLGPGLILTSWTQVWISWVLPCLRHEHLIFSKKKLTKNLYSASHQEIVNFVVLQRGYREAVRIRPDDTRHSQELLRHCWSVGHGSRHYELVQVSLRAFCNPHSEGHWGIILLVNSDTVDRWKNKKFNYSNTLRMVL